MKKANEVVDLFIQGESCMHSHATLRTDGINLWSYDLKIAWRQKGEVCTIKREECVKPDGSRSATTSKHLSLVLYAIGAEN